MQVGFNLKIFILHHYVKMKTEFVGLGIHLQNEIILPSFSVAKATLHSPMSVRSFVCQSVRKQNPSNT